MRGNYDVGTLREVVSSSFCMSDVCRRLNITVCSFNFARIRHLIMQHGISTTHFDLKNTFRRNKVTWTADDVFCENSLVSRSSLRSHAKRAGLYTGRCEECKIGDSWKASRCVSS